MVEEKSLLCNVWFRLAFEFVSFGVYSFSVLFWGPSCVCFWCLVFCFVGPLLGLAFVFAGPLLLLAHFTFVLCTISVFVLPLHLF